MYEFILISAAPPGEVFKYSDLSLITLSIVVGKVVLDNKLISSKGIIPIF